MVIKTEMPSTAITFIIKTKFLRNTEKSCYQMSSVHFYFEVKGIYQHSLNDSMLQVS